MESLWMEYPNYPTLELKLYYLIQIGFWLQQAIYLFTETRRKDFVIMATHHFITISLLLSSYYMSYIKAGHVILVTMDFADIFLTVIKLLI